MLERIISFSIQNKLIIGLCTLGLVIWGIFSLTQLPIDAVPDITNNQVQVITVSPSLAAQEIERLITFPIEQTMATIPKIEEIRSFSRFGLSVVTIIFHDGVDIYWARQQVNEKLGEAKTNIPEGIGEPGMAPISTGLGEIYQYIVHPKEGYKEKYDAMELRTIQDWIVRRQLLGIPGVADVSSFGGYLKQYEVAVDPDKLRSYNISITEIFNALERNNQNAGGGYIDKLPNTYFIRTEGLIQNISDVEKIVVKNTKDGTPLLIRNIAEVRFGHANRFGAMTRNNDGEVVGAIVMMLKGENSNEVVKRVKERIEQIQKTLPEGVVIETFLDRSNLVNRAITTVTTNLIEGALIVIFVLVLFLGNFRAGLVTASVIPLSMLFAVSMMNVFGVSGNLMSLGAIDFGLIVDGAVIIVEAVMHYLHRGKLHTLTQNEMDDVVKTSAGKLMSAAAFGQIIILIVYLPILALVGVEGKMFKPMAQTVSFAIFGALLLSLTYIPMISSLVLSKKISYKKNISDKIMDRIQNWYTPTIHIALHNKKAVLFGALSLFIVTMFIFLNMGGEFLPTLEEGDFAVETRVMTGSSLLQTVDAAQKSSKVLLEKFPEVKEVVGKIGSSEIPTDPMPIEACDLMIILKDKSEWTSADSRDELAEKMQTELEQNIPGVEFGFQQPIQMRFNELMAGIRQDIGIKIFGEDLDELTRLSKEVGKAVGSIDGMRDLYLESITGLSQIVVKINRDNVASFGLDIETVNQAVTAAFAGQSAGLVYEGERRFDLVVRFDNQNRQKIEDVRNLYVTAPNGNQIPLQQLASIKFILGPNQIQREDAKRKIVVGFNVRGRDVETVVTEARKKIEASVKLPPGYFITYGGQFENLEKARARLLIAVPAALLLIFVLLYFTFNSLKQSVLIFAAIPLAAIGGVLALLVRGMPFSISAGVGFIALFGVAVLNGIVLISEFNTLKKEGIESLHDIVIRGTKIRLRPVMMTALVASLGFLPMALSSSSGAEVQKPLATVVIGGLITSTLLTLIVLPILYIYFEQGIRVRLKRIIPFLLPLILFLPIGANGQIKKLSLNDALHIAKEKNKTLTAARYELDAQQSLSNTSTDIGKLSVIGTFGQYSSFEKDNNFSISQTFPFPTLFFAKGSLGNARVKGSKYVLTGATNDVLFHVKSAWYQLAFRYELHKWLIRQDSIFTDFARSSLLRKRAGETNLLEQLTAESRARQARTELQRNRADIEILQKKLQTLLHSNEEIDIAYDTLSARILPKADSTLLLNSPMLNVFKQLSVIAEYEKSVEVNSLLPDITIGFFSQTLISAPLNGGGSSFATRSDRFQGFEIGVSIPLWFYPQNSKVSAAEYKHLAAEQHYFQQKKNIEGEYAEAMREADKHRESIDFYISSALPQAELIIQQSRRAYAGGEIGYLEYTQSLNTASDIYIGYLSTLNNYNQSIIHVEHILGIY